MVFEVFAGPKQERAMQSVLQHIAEKKAELDRLRSLSHDVIASLQKYYDVELTYTSNAIEGNTLTVRETAVVIEHGITVGGKNLRDHLEAVDHYEALQWIRDLAAQETPMGEAVVRELHRRPENPQPAVPEDLRCRVVSEQASPK